MKLLIALTVCAAPAFAECPPPPDISAAQTALLSEVQAAPTQMAADLLTNELWDLWAKAPDQYAQELLDTGLERLSSFDLNGAIIAFDALVEYCPDYAEGYNQRAFIAYMRQDYDAALADLNAAIERSPNHVAALAGKALTLIGLGREAAAQLTLRDALALHPWLPERGLLKKPQGEDL